MPKVYIEKFSGYQDERIIPFIRDCINSVPFDFRNKKVLLKPNMLMGKDPVHSITTHPVIIEAAARILREKGAKVLIGDSPGMPLPPALVARQLGLTDMIRKTGMEFVDFTRDPIRITRKENKLVKTFILARIVRDVDFILNLSKLKTHVQAVYTGAIKNLFGFIPGILKSQFHLKFPDTGHFGQMIADLALIIKPGLSIMDGIIAMEGQGPSNGRPKQLGLLIASQDMVALDSVACYCIGQDPFQVPIIAKSFESGLGEIDLSRIEVIGQKDPDKLRDRSFLLIPGRSHMHFRITEKLHPLLKQYFIARPVIKRKKCVKCHVCVKVCPVKAMSASRNEVPVYDYVKCIRCYCCHEMCPEQAIFKKDNLMTRIMFGKSVGP
ncbi:MAG: DUF362 domain-containing protein [bacterium]|nr:DUF362 domain-containing protein [bacterium]